LKTGITTDTSGRTRGQYKASLRRAVS
jgi:hypothetical protein